MRSPGGAASGAMPAHFGLYLVLTDPVAGFERCAEAAVRAGVRCVQLRMKGASRAEVVAMARRLRAITAGSATRLIVNDDADAAAEAEADGVHLGQEDEPLVEARRRHPELKIFGLSTHNEAQAATAAALRPPPEYIGVGPIFPTPTKTRPDPVLGLKRAGRILAATPITAVVIGGIDEHNLPDVLRAGARNFAVVRAVCADPDPAAAINRLQTVWRRFV